MKIDAKIHSYNPGATYTMEELSVLTGISSYSIAHYIREGLVPGPERRGRATRYGEAIRVRLLAVRQLRARSEKLGKIRAVLGAATEAELLEISGLFAPGAVTTASAGTRVVTSGPYKASAALPRETWESVEVCPGLRVMVRADADTEARRIADEIQARYKPA